MYITFLETHRMSEDGFSAHVYEAGQTYDLARSCACRALHSHWAVPATPEEALQYVDAEFNHNHGGQHA